MKKLLLLLTLLAPSVQAELVQVNELTQTQTSKKCTAVRELAEVAMEGYAKGYATFEQSSALNDDIPLWKILVREAYSVELKLSEQEEVELFGLQQERACLEYYYALTTRKWED